jgi:hypothetical protein
MDREQEIIHHQMEATRAGLTDKLSALENKVSGTVEAATNAVETTREAVTGTVEAVTDTVETVKETVQETVEKVTETVSETVGAVTEQFQETVQSVAETFNLRLQAERHPWLVFGGAVAAGAVGGYLIGGLAHGNGDRAASHAQPERHTGGPSVVGTAASAVGSALGGFLGEQLSNFKGLAIGAMMGVVRDLVKRSLPDNLKEKVADEVDKLTRNLGGEPMQGSILPEPSAEATESAPADRGHPPSTYGGVGRAESSARRQGETEFAATRY